MTMASPRLEDLELTTEQWALQMKEVLEIEAIKKLFKIKKNVLLRGKVAFALGEKVAFAE